MYLTRLREGKLGKYISECNGKYSVTSFSARILKRAAWDAGFVPGITVLVHDVGILNHSLLDDHLFQITIHIFFIYSQERCFDF
jgi:hypothetical protein